MSHTPTVRIENNTHFERSRKETESQTTAWYKLEPILSLESEDTFALSQRQKRHTLNRSPKDWKEKQLMALQKDS